MRKITHAVFFCLLGGCENREFVAGSEEPADAGAPAEDADSKNKVLVAYPAPESRRGDGALDTVFIIDNASYPKAGAADVAGEIEWFSALMNIYFNLEVNYISEPILATRQAEENDWVFSLRALEENLVEYPEYIALFSYGNGLAGQYGGYFAGVFSPNNDYCNEFESVYGQGILLGLIDLEHLFGRCGYDRKTGEHVSMTAFNWECRGYDDMPCVWSGEYFVCEYLLGHPFVEDLDFFHGFVVAHELFHAWGENHEGCLESGLEECEVTPEISEGARQLNTCECNVLRFFDSWHSCEEGN